MWKPSKLGIALFVSLSVVACAKKQKNFSNPIFTIPTESLSEAQTIASNPVVKCEDGRNKCDPAVGMLTMATEESSGVCSATLVGPDLAITNSHCIPKDLKERGSNCKNRIWLSFPTDPAHPEYDPQVRCSQVLLATDIGEEDGDSVLPDVAFLRLERKVNRPSLSLSRAGFKDNDSVSITRVDPSFHSKKAHGHLRSMACKTIFGTSILPEANQRLSDLMIFSDCRVIQGNSGSAIRGSDGAVLGVIQAFFNTSGMSERLKTRGYQMLDDTIDHINVGTSLACLADLPIAQAINPACASRLTQEENEDLIAAERNNKLNREFQALVQKKLNLSEISWDAEPIRRMESRWDSSLGKSVDILRHYLDPVPYCVNPEKLTASKLKKALNIPRFEMVRGVDRYTRQSISVRETDLSTQESTLEIEELSGEERGFYRLKLSHLPALAGEPELIPAMADVEKTISSCGPSPL
jgi:hypothetical protein